MKKNNVVTITSQADEDKVFKVMKDKWSGDHPRTHNYGGTPEKPHGFNLNDDNGKPAFSHCELSYYQRKENIKEYNIITMAEFLAMYDAPKLTGSALRTAMKWKWVELVGLKDGDTVKISGRIDLAKEYSISNADSKLGKEFTVNKVNCVDYAIYLSDGMYWPYECLEKYVKPKPVYKDLKELLNKKMFVGYKKASGSRMWKGVVTYSDNMCNAYSFVYHNNYDSSTLMGSHFQEDYQKGCYVTFDTLAELSMWLMTPETTK